MSLMNKWSNDMNKPENIEENRHHSKSNLNDRLGAVVDSATKLMLFIKMNEFPEPYSEGYFEIGRLTTVLENNLRIAGVIPKGKIGT